MSQSYLPETETKSPIVTGPDQGKTVGVLGGRSIFKATSADTNGAYAILVQEIPPGAGPPLHVHRHETEVFFILEGQFELRVGETKMSAPPGTTAVCPRDIPHTFRNVGSQTGKILLTVIPGRFADYFLEVDGVRDHNKETIRQLTAKYDVEILE